jgi:hypothetical protein
MLLGFISLLLTAFQGLISRICVRSHLTSFMLPCKRDTGSEHHSHLNTNNRRRLLSEEANSGQCLREVYSQHASNYYVVNDHEQERTMLYIHKYMRGKENEEYI